MRFFTALDDFVHQHDLGRFWLGRAVCDWYERWLSPDGDCGCK